MTILIYLAIIIAALVLLARVHLSFYVWLVLLAVTFVLLMATGHLSGIAAVIVWMLYTAMGVFLGVADIRRKWISRPLLNYIRKALPPMSATEREAVEAGTVWWDADLLQGDPDWKKLLDIPAPKLNKEEQAFLDGPVEKLCTMLDDWQITHELNDLPPKVWEFIKAKGFFGMIIPKKYGGLEFSAHAHSQVIMKIGSRSGTAAVTAMVPNSLGPAELLLNYGTDKQKKHYLPRLAGGEEVPCFALTGPFAGSDAGAMPDTGIVCKQKYKGKQTLGLRLNWEKRYITLGPVATVLGLAFHAYDPEHLLGDQEDLGITCALIPTDTPGVEIGRRHAPLDSAFQNGPNSGKDVFIPMDWVIGGQEMIGHGWRMLVERLAVGRGISLPATSTGAAKLASQTTGAYARVRKQFHLSIGKFEGVEEALARIGGLTYMMDAARTLTTSALDIGEKPSVISAIVKYYLTENMRQLIDDAMDIHGGRGICLGPSNYLGRIYQTVPVGITVEGANILTRSMIIFGQGAMRCHPYLQEEIAAANEEDEEKALARFDAALFGHLGYSVSNAARAFVYATSGGLLAPSPVSGPTASYYRKLARFSAATAALADVSLLVLGGAFKRKEKLSGRFADALGYMYLCSAVLKRFEDDGRPKADLPLVQWSCEHCLHKIQHALDGVIRNFPVRPIAWKLRAWALPLGRRLHGPSDRLGHQVASLLLEPSATRDRLIGGIYYSIDPGDSTGRLEHALKMTLRAEPIERKLRKAGEIYQPDQDYNAWLDDLVTAKVLNKKETGVLRDAQKAERVAIMVDDFAPVAAPAPAKRRSAKSPR
ncbi:MAG: acyl-CoA dehydrogenase [Mariprofundaceae bacterium]